MMGAVPALAMRKSELDDQADASPAVSMAVGASSRWLS